MVIANAFIIITKTRDFIIMVKVDRFISRPLLVNLKGKKNPNKNAFNKIYPNFNY